MTENNSKPDFLFPSFACYHDLEFSAERLIVLGAKTTCKDRWRQVLAEAHRVQRKHLITLEPAISVAQTEEMKASQLQLVVPSALHATFTANQAAGLIDVAGFIAEAHDAAM